MNVMEKQPDPASIEAVLGVHKKKRRGLGLGWFLVVAVCLAGAYFYVSHNKEPQALYVTAMPSRGDLTVTVTATGTVFPTNQVDVSSELSGIIRTVLVDHNDPVKKGQVLAELDTVTLTALVERSRAALLSARARVAQAEATVAERGHNFERQKTLNTQRINSENALDVAKADYDRAVASVASAKADVDVAQAELKQNETNLAKTKLYSPVDGVVLKRNVEPGQTVASAFQAPVLFTLAEDLRRIELRVDIDEADIGKVMEGQTATFTVEAYPGRKFPAKIQQLRYASETVNNVVTYKAILRAGNPGLSLRPGMTATAEIVVEEVKGALLIPNAALRFAPPVPKKEKSGGFTLFRMPRMQASAPAIDTTNPQRRIYGLREGQPAAIDISVGASDKKMTEVKAPQNIELPVITDLEEPGTK